MEQKMRPAERHITDASPTQLGNMIRKATGLSLLDSHKAAEKMIEQNRDGDRTLLLEWWS